MLVDRCGSSAKKRIVAEIGTEVVKILYCRSRANSKRVRDDVASILSGGEKNIPNWKS